MESRSSGRDRVRLGLLGCGTVGSAVMRALAGDTRLAARYEVSAVAVRNRDRPRDCAVAPRLLSTSPLEVTADRDVDVVVEVMGGLEPARACIEEALDAGTPVVTANKALLAEHGEALQARADACGADLRFEAAVAGAVPVVRTLRQLVRTDTVDRIDAVLNGTTTYVLAHMAATGAPLQEAVARAQELGYAEADPARDLDGRDAADKLTLLARLVWGVSLRPEEVLTMGLAGLSAADAAAARSAGFAWQVVASATPGCARVEPARLPLEHPLARLTGTDNAVQVTTRRSGVLTLAGPGAGGDATAASVLADLDEVASRLPAATRTFAGQLCSAGGIE